MPPEYPHGVLCIVGSQLQVVTVTGFPSSWTVRTCCLLPAAGRTWTHGCTITEDDTEAAGFRGSHPWRTCSSIDPKATLTPAWGQTSGSTSPLARRAFPPGLRIRVIEVFVRGLVTESSTRAVTATKAKRGEPEVSKVAHQTLAHTRGQPMGPLASGSIANHVPAGRPIQMERSRIGGPSCATPARPRPAFRVVYATPFPPTRTERLERKRRVFLPCLGLRRSSRWGYPPLPIPEPLSVRPKPAPVLGLKSEQSGK